MIDRMPRHFLALTTCVLAFLLGLAVGDDYGVFGDTQDQRAIGEATLRHLAGERGLNLLWPPEIRLYGPVFETPLALIERILGRDDSRSIYLSRHLLTHLFFLASAFAGYLLALRMFGRRWLALFALLLFLLHPRIYANSFFNSKDVPFLAMFMICLWLAHRAFTASGASAARGAFAIHGAFAIYGAFALCGAAAGLLTNLRFMGLAFVALVVFVCLCDVVVAGSRSERRRAIASCAVFAFASVATYYATMPYLWADPLARFMEMLTVLSAHPNDWRQFFQGELVLGSKVPRGYLPVWFGITAPPLALLLGVVGLTFLLWRVVITVRPRYGQVPPPPPQSLALLRNTPLRFELLMVACCVLPVLAVIVLRPPLYGWRYFYFLWAPFVLLATIGLGALGGGARNVFQHFQKAPRPPTRPWVPTAIVACLAALGLGAIALEMVRLHPHQHLYFNVLANRPGAAVPLHQRFSLRDGYYREQGYAYILEELAVREHPDAVFNIDLPPFQRGSHLLSLLDIAIPRRNMELYRQRDQRRFKYDSNADIDFYVASGGRFGNPEFFPPVLYQREIYGKEIMKVATPDLARVDEATAQAYRANYRAVTSAAPVFSGDVDVYRGERTISWVRAHCAPGEVNGIMEMTVVPLDAALPRYEKQARGVRVGDACLWQAPLPDHAFAKMLFPTPPPGIGVLVSNAYLEERRRQHAALSATQPVARSTFNVYLEDGTLFYVKTPCVQADVEAPFFLHVRPARVGDLPSYRRRHGFEVLDFRFGGLDPRWGVAPGDIFDDVCVAEIALPDYSVASIGTGQFVPGGAELWRVDIGA